MDLRIPLTVNDVKMEQKLRTDFHLHTIDDPRDKQVWHTAFELFDKAAFLGYRALAITLHGRQHFPPEWLSYTADLGITLIPGVEQDIEGCHVLLLNFDRDAANGIRSFEELARERRPENLVVAAHPFFPSSICLQEKLIEHAELFDAIEVTGFYQSGWNPNTKAIQVAAELKLPILGNSDTHTLEQLGSTFSEVTIAGEANPLNLVKAIKAGRVEVQSRALGALEMGRITWKVVGRGYMPWVDDKRTRGMKAAP